jgi:hypothetical protein
MESTASLLRLPVVGRNLEGPTLGSTLGDDPTLLVFLRHLG